MFGDRKPYPVAVITLDPEAVVPWAEANGHDRRPGGAGRRTTSCGR